MIKWTQELVIDKLKSIFGDLYDYSEVVYTRLKTPVRLYCKKHHCWFEKMPDAMFRHGVGCPLCYEEHKKTDYQNRAKKSKQTVLQKYGVENVMQVDDIQRKQKQSVFESYGVDNPMQSQDIVRKAQMTNIERYGATSYMGSDEGKTCVEATNLKRYGAKNFMQSDAHLSVVDDMQKKAQETSLLRYGASHFSQSEEFKKGLRDRKSKEFETKKANGTLVTSQPEHVLYDKLCGIFGAFDVEKQYVSDVYPFACDFYIKSRDLYIELNAHWTHGDMPFVDDNSDCQDVYQMWIEKSKSSDFYKNAVDVWTHRDVEKRHTAKQNNLNYLTFWDSDLRDFDLWEACGCPDGKDYDVKYSWMKG